MRSTGLSSDTIIGVFFAGAVGLAAALKNLIQSRVLYSLEDFLFGNPLQAKGRELVILVGLTLFTAILLSWMYNHLLLTSFNSSLALSRRVPVQLVNYLFIILLALIVNLCLRLVGALLINALLIIPAAAAVNVSRNMHSYSGCRLVSPCWRASAANGLAGRWTWGPTSSWVFPAPSFCSA